MRSLIFILICLFTLPTFADSNTQMAKMNDEVKGILEKASKAVRTDLVKDAKSMLQTANMTIANMGIKGIVKVSLKGEKIRVESQTADILEVNGFDGKGAWSENITTGLRMLEGAEKLNLIAETLPFTFTPEKFYDSIELMGKAQFNNKECFKIKFSKKGMDPVIEYYDTKTYLALGEERIIPNPMGKMKASTVYGNYIKHEKGFLYPATMVQSMGPVKVEIKVTGIKLNVEMDDKIFAVPAQ